ncbi:MAG: F0F1 ATP synthase subunit alpha, partial [Candidatus Saccharibacteria bacterium]
MIDSGQYLIKKLTEELEVYKPDPKTINFGKVISVFDGIAKVSGLSEVMSFEMVQFKSGIYGIALNLEEDQVGVVVLGGSELISQGDEVRCTGKVLEVPVSDEIIGRVIDPLGMPIDEKGNIKIDKYQTVEKAAPGVIERKSVSVSLQTGVKAIDSVIPIGQGQRELIIGDRQTGKTAIAIDTIINQKDKDVICIYVAIGQKRSKIAKIVAEFEKHDCMKNT